MFISEVDALQRHMSACGPAQLQIEKIQILEPKWNICGFGKIANPLVRLLIKVLTMKQRVMRTDSGVSLRMSRLEVA